MLFLLEEGKDYLMAFDKIWNTNFEEIIQAFSLARLAVNS